MNNPLRLDRCTSWLAMLALGTVLAACGGGDQGRDPILGVDAAILNTVAVTPAAGSVPVGAAQQYVATATYSDGSSRDVTTASAWASAQPTIATVNASTGLAVGVAAGAATISASFNGKSGSAVLTVLPATLVSMTIAPLNPALNIGLTQQFTAAGIYTDGSARNISALATFTSATPAVASTTAAGLATTVSAGTSVITATVGTLSASTTLTVNPTILQSLALTPVNPTLAIGATQALVATATYSNGTNVVVSTSAAYSSASPLVATVNASTGMVTAVAAGTSVITATFGGKTATTTVTVSPAPIVVPPGAVTLSSIAVTPSAATVTVGSTQAFVATASYSDGTTANVSALVSWTSGTVGVATILPGGTASALALGTSTMTASLDGKSGNATLTVAASAPAAVSVNLGTAANFGVLAGNSITNNSGGTTVVTGDVGSPSQTVDPVQVAGYANYKSGLPLTQALADLQVAITDANSRACTVNSAAGIDLGGLTYGPGVYCYAGAISITGTFTMNGPGLYIFRSASTLNSTANSIVALNGGATAGEVFWVPSGATTLGANSVFKGTVMGQSSAITMGDGASLQNGRVLSGSAVTLRNNVISK
jgi:uncharacterized protein YjdB